MESGTCGAGKKYSNLGAITRHSSNLTLLAFSDSHVCILCILAITACVASIRLCADLDSQHKPKCYTGHVLRFWGTVGTVHVSQLTGRCAKSAYLVGSPVEGRGERMIFVKMLNISDKCFASCCCIFLSVAWLLGTLGCRHLKLLTVLPFCLVRPCRRWI